MRTAAKLTALLVLATCMVGCIHMKRADTFYVQPDMSFSWLALQTNIHSDQDAKADREREEREVIDPVLRGEHRLAKAMAAAGGADIRCELIRASRPYAILTEANFASIEALGGQLVSLSGITGGVSLVEADGIVTWTVTLYPSGESTAPEADRDHFGQLIGGLADLNIILAEGNFVAATSFAFEKDSDTARFDIESIKNYDPKSGEPFVMSLSWTAASLK